MQYPPPPSHHHDGKMASYAPSRGPLQPSSREMQQQAGATGTTLPPHMTHAHAGYGQQHPQQPRSYQAPPHAAAQQDQLPDPLPPHLQHMASPQGRGSSSQPGAGARANSIPDHLQPRPFPQQQEAPRQQQDQVHVHGVQQQPYLQQPSQQQQPSVQRMGVYPTPRVPAASVRKPGPRPGALGSSGPTRSAHPPGLEPAYQAQMPYVSSGGNAPLPATTGALDEQTDAACQPSSPQASGWYHGTGQAHQAQAQSGQFSSLQQQHRQQQHRQQQQQQQAPPSQQQQRPYDAEFQQAPTHVPAPAAPQPHLQQLQLQPQQVQAHKQRQQQQLQQQQQQQQYPPASQQQAPPAQQYQQQPYLQHLRPIATESDAVGQMPRAQQALGHTAQPPSAAHGNAVANAATPTAPSTASASEAPQYPPPPPAQLRPAAVEVAATPVSFVQLVPQTAGIQIDHSGAVRVVVQPAAQDSPPGAGAAAGSGQGQPMMPPSQPPATAAYGPVPTQQQQSQPQQQQQQELQQQSQSQRHGRSISGPSSQAQPPPQYMAKERSQSAPQHGYDLSPSYQQPGGGGGGSATANGGPSGVWDEPAGHRDAAAYGPYSSRLDGGDAPRTYMPAAERSRPPPPPQPMQQRPQDGGYIVYEDIPAVRYSGTVGRRGLGDGDGAGGGGMERRSSRAQPPELETMPVDAYAASAGARRVVVERLDSRGDGGGYTEDPRRTSAGGGLRNSFTVPAPAPPPVAEEPPLPLAEAIRRAEALVAAVAATRVDGELMNGMLPQLLQTCEKRMHDLSWALRAASADAASARAAADAAAAKAAKAAAAAAEAAAGAAADEELGNVRAGHLAFLVERSIRTVWPLDTPEHQLYRTVAEVLMLEDGGKVVPVNKKEVKLQPYEMVGATLCNQPAVQEKVAEVKASGGGSTMVLLRQEVYFDVREHIHKELPTSVQWLVRLRAEKLPSYKDLQEVLRAAINTLLPPPPPQAAAGRSSEALSPSQQQEPHRQSGGRVSGGSPSRGRGSLSGSAREAGETAIVSPELQFLAHEPEGPEERLALRHVALHLLGCKGKEVGLFSDKIENCAAKLPPRLAKLYGEDRLSELKQLLKSHPFFWVSPKSVYGADGLNCFTHDCVALHTGSMLELEYRVRLAQQEQQTLHQSKKRKTGATAAAAAAVGGGAEGAESAAALEEWWLDLRSKRPRLRSVGGA